MTVPASASMIPPILATTQDGGGAGPTIAFVATVTVAAIILGLMVRRAMSGSTPPPPPATQDGAHGDAVEEDQSPEIPDLQPRTPPDASEGDDPPPRGT